VSGRSSELDDDAYSAVPKGVSSCHSCPFSCSCSGSGDELPQIHPRRMFCRRQRAAARSAQRQSMLTPRLKQEYKSISPSECGFEKFGRESHSFRFSSVQRKKVRPVTPSRRTQDAISRATRSGGRSPDRTRSALVKYTDNCEGVHVSGLSGKSSFGSINTASSLSAKYVGSVSARVCEEMYHHQIRCDADGWERVREMEKGKGVCR
jgi:hypothetical protein